MALSLIVGESRCIKIRQSDEVRCRLLAFLLAFGSAGRSVSGGKESETKRLFRRLKAATKKLTEEQKVAHLLDRVTFGARPGDVERVMKLGWEKYLDEQFRPERISDQLARAEVEEYRKYSSEQRRIGEELSPPKSFNRF